MNHVLDVRTLPSSPGGRMSAEWWGIAGLIVIEGMVFIALVVSYFHLGQRNPSWPPPGIEAPHVPLATLNTLLLIASAAPIWLAARTLSRGSERAAKLALASGIVLLAVFLGIKLYEYLTLPWGPRTHAYGSVVFAMSGLHMVHVFAVLVKSSVVLVYIHQRRIDPERRAALDANALYWYFVIAVWLPLYGAIYWAPRLF
ncbi:MAG TPA: cytochrome c oxidase subunit 3 [Gemmatimonadaceae bacterium]|nr:cytochrome c oxidase subunit 3 [Gemmatimonadaceae bacterium]